MVDNHAGHHTKDNESVRKRLKKNAPSQREPSSSLPTSSWQDDTKRAMSIDRTLTTDGQWKNDELDGVQEGDISAVSSPQGGGFFVDDSSPHSRSSQPLLQTQEMIASTQAENVALQSSGGDFYANLHADDSEDDNNDIAWESEGEGEGKIGKTEEINAINNEVEVIIEESRKDNDSDFVPEIVVILEEDSNSHGLLSQPLVSLENEAENSNSLLSYVEPRVDFHGGNDQGALNRAVETASKMADWAGRAVKRALKDHLKSEPSESLFLSVVGGGSSAHVEDVPTAASGASQTSKSGIGLSSQGDRETSPFEWEPDLGKADAEDSNMGRSGEVDVVTRSRGAVSEWDESGTGDGEIESEEVVMKRLSTSARDVERLTEEMKEEVIQLLEAFGLPFLVAPYEAEAQCAVLEQLHLVDGVITEDSDVLLFGAQAVYKNIFSDRKFVEVYLAEDAKRELGVAREDLIALAFFLGSDYTEGVHGIGMVNAMEIIEAFPMKAETGGPIKGLSKFKEWLEGYDFAQEILNELEAKKAKNGKEAVNPDYNISNEDEVVLTEEKLSLMDQRLVSIFYQLARLLYDC